MAGIVKSTKRRYLIGKRIKEVDVPGTELDTDLFFEDLQAMGGYTTSSVVTSELNRLPTIVKQESVLTLVSNPYNVGEARAINGDTKTVEALSFSRDSASTFCNDNGLISNLAPSLPRRDYNPSNLQIQGYLIEKASTNLLTDSGVRDGIAGFGPLFQDAEIVDTGWNKGALLDRGVRISLGSQSSYAYKYYLGQEVGKTYTFSCYVKKSNGAAIISGDFLLRANGDNIGISKLTLMNTGGGVYRLVFTYVHSGVGSSISSIGIIKTNTTNDIDITSSGYQLEEGAIATSYIPTTDAAATRLADVITSKRPLNIYPKNSWYIESSVYTGWFGDGVDKLDMPGRNYFSNTNVVGMALSSISIASGNAGYKSFYIPVKEGDIFSLSRDEITNNRFRYAFTAEIPSPDVVYFGGTGLNPDYDESLKIEGIVVPEGANYIFVYLSNQSDELPKIKLERGPVATPWSPAPEDLVKIDESGNLTVESSGSDHLRSLSLVPRALTQEEI